MTDIVCSNPKCNHQNSDIKPHIKNCEVCGERLKIPINEKKQTMPDEEIVIYIEDYFATQSAGCRATFSFNQLEERYKEANIRVSCPYIGIENHYIDCKFNRNKRPHLHFKPEINGLFTLDFELECIKEDGSIDIYEAEADLNVEILPSGDININNNNTQETTLNREGGVHQSVKVDAASTSHSPSKRAYEPQAISLGKVKEHIPANPSDTGAFRFIQGGKLPKCWVSTKTTTIFGRADASKNGVPYLDETDIPISFLSQNTESDNSISRKHFEITRTTQGYELSYANVHPSRSLYINKNTPEEVLIIKGGDNGKTNSSHEQILLRKGDIITLCNVREKAGEEELSYKVTSCHVNAELCLVRENYHTHEECYILMPSKLDLAPYVEWQAGSHNIELIHKGYAFYLREAGSGFEQVIVKGKSVKIQNIELCLLM